MVFRNYGKKYTAYKKGYSRKRKNYSSRYSNRKSYVKGNKAKVSKALYGKANKIYYANQNITTPGRWREYIKNKDLIIQPYNLMGRAVKCQMLYAIPFVGVNDDVVAYQTQADSWNEIIDSLRYPNYAVTSTILPDQYSEYVQPGQAMGNNGNPFLQELGLYRKFICNKMGFSINAEAIQQTAPGNFFNEELGIYAVNGVTNDVQIAVTLNVYSGSSLYYGNIPKTTNYQTDISWLNLSTANDFVKDLNLKKIMPDKTGFNYRWTLYNQDPIDKREYEEIYGDGPPTGAANMQTGTAYICIEWICTYNQALSQTAQFAGTGDPALALRITLPPLEIHYYKKICCYEKQSILGSAIVNTIKTNKKEKREKENEIEIEELQTLSQKCLESLHNLQLNKPITKKNK